MNKNDACVVMVLVSITRLLDAVDKFAGVGYYCCGRLLRFVSVSKSFEGDALGLRFLDGVGDVDGL